MQPCSGLSCVLSLCRDPQDNVRCSFRQSSRDGWIQELPMSTRIHSKLCWWLVDTSACSKRAPPLADTQSQNVMVNPPRAESGQIYATFHMEALGPYHAGSTIPHPASRTFQSKASDTSAFHLILQGSESLSFIPSTSPDC